MIDTKSMFRSRKLVPEKLLKNGFQKDGVSYQASFPMMDGKFRLAVTLTKAEDVSAHVYDGEGEYVLANSPVARGGFVNEVITSAEEILKDIAQTCGEWEPYQQPQAKALIAWIKEQYHAELEFLWENDESAIFRRFDTQTWFALFMKIQAKKGDKTDSTTIIEVMNVRVEENAIDGKMIYPGYHMNKKHWGTLLLDGSVPMETLQRLVKESYERAKK